MSTSVDSTYLKSVTIAGFKRDLLVLLKEVAKGESILVQKGPCRENVAVLVPSSSVHV